MFREVQRGDLRRCRAQQQHGRVQVIERLERRPLARRAVEIVHRRDDGGVRALAEIERCGCPDRSVPGTVRNSSATAPMVLVGDTSGV